MMPHLSDVPASDVARTFAALRDVNEQLVLAALRSQVDTEARQLDADTLACVVTLRAETLALAVQMDADALAGAVKLEADTLAGVVKLGADTLARAVKLDADTLARTAMLDALTALPNKALLLARLELAIALARKTNSRLALLYLDLYNFRQINDTLGHLGGDDVLKAVARTLVAISGTASTVSRHSGDEFVIMLTDITEPAHAGSIAEKILSALGSPMRIREHAVSLRGSIGISVFPDDSTDARALIDLADAAMYEAKRRGISGVAFNGDASDGGTAGAPIAGHLQTPVIEGHPAVGDRRHREWAIRDANEQLLLKAMSASASNAEAEDARHRQTQFLGKLAHELRNPLAPLLNVATLLKGMRADDTSLPKLQGMIERQVLFMSRLVEDLVDFTRASTGKLSLRIVPVSILAVIAEAVGNCRSATDLRHQTVTTHVPPLALYVDGDRDRLLQVLCNLLDNASKYTPDHGAITVAVTTEGTVLRITVSDNGIGISAEALPGIFDLFVQDRHAVEFSGAGLGIGLAVVHELVNAHDGSVEARSAGPGQGSTFVITLPLATLQQLPRGAARIE